MAQTAGDRRRCPGADQAEAVQIYTELYLVRPGFDKIADMRLRHLVVDSGVQHGQGRPIKWIQDRSTWRWTGSWGRRP